MNCTSSAVVTANGGTITNAQYGVFANNFEGYNSDANSGAVGIDGINIDGSAIAGVYVLDSPDNTNNATIDLTVNHCAINNSVVGVLIEGLMPQLPLITTTLLPMLPLVLTTCLAIR